MGGTVVLFQQNGPCTRKISLKFFDVANRCTAESIDRLVGVADNRQLPRFHSIIPGAYQFADQHVLRMVRVLILIDQDMAEATMVVLGDRRVVFEQAYRARNQVIKVQSIGLCKTLLIFFVSRGNNSRNWVIRRGISVFLPRDELILEVRNTRGNQLGRESFDIHIRCFQHHLDQALRVLRIVDTESRAQTGRAVFRTQYSHTRRVES